MRTSSYAVAIHCALAAATSGCAAQTDPGPSNIDTSSNSGEPTDQSREKLSSACSGGANGAYLSATPWTGIFSNGVTFSGFCFDGGALVAVKVVDDVTGANLGNVTVTAGPDSALLPGSISESFVAGCTTNSVHLEAFSWAATAKTSSFYLSAWPPC